MSTLTRRLLLRERRGGGSGGPAMYYISPSGDNGNDGLSTGAPLLTFAVALPLLTPGSTLVLMDGTYTLATSGFPVIDPAVDAGIESGTAGARITVRAQNERAALFDMSTITTGDQVGFKVKGVDYWDIRGIYVDGADINASGSSEKSNIRIENASNIRLYRCLSTHNNRYGNVHLIEFVGCTDSLAEECEGYWHHRHGFMAYESERVTFRRCITGGRGWGNRAGGYVNNLGVGNTTGSDEGQSHYRSSDCIFENCITMSGNGGFEIHGGPIDDDPTNLAASNIGGQRNKVLGCIHLGREGELTQLQTVPDETYLGTIGVKIDTREVPDEIIGTSTAGSASTITLKATASSITNEYVGWTIHLTGAGTGSGDSLVCSAYNGTTKVATMTGTWATWDFANITYWVTNNQFFEAADNVVEHMLIWGSKRGFSMESDIRSEVRNCTITNIGPAGSGVRFQETNGKVGGAPMCPLIGCSSHFVNCSFFSGSTYGSTRFTADLRPIDGTDILVEWSNASGFAAQNFHPTETVTDTSGAYRNCTETAPIAFLPSDGDYTPIWVNPDNTVCYETGEDGANMGCDILYRYENGVLTDTPLWDPATGTFPHGAIVAGVNDIANESLATIHSDLLNVSPTTLPAGYGS